MSNVRIVCEGGCNPDLHDYDTVVGQFAALASPGTLDYVKHRAKTLVHTEHEMVRGWHWGVDIKGEHGWMRSFRCEICGNIRKF